MKKIQTFFSYVVHLRFIPKIQLHVGCSNFVVF
jgi:hypothetical protein